ncbi:MAG: hypothetical protein HY666_03045 [Chloroflexi bacterium]|nr:hypothetical protein [Chloroflexota bacterium]
MIRPLQPTDVFRYSLLNRLERVNRAQRLEELVKESPNTLNAISLAKEALPVKGKSLCLVAVSKGGLTGLASARSRAGPKCWEVAELFSSHGNEQDICELLEGLGLEAAQRDAERVFLRLLRDDPIADIARQAGFLPCFVEFLYRGQVYLDSFGSSLPSSLRTRTAADDHSLFRLYNAATPPKVKHALGMTLEEWRDSQERFPVRCHEVVSEVNGSITCLIKTVQYRQMGQLDIVVHPDEESRLPDLVDYGLRRFAQGNWVAVRVADYQLSLSRLIEERGFRRMSEYDTTVKFLAMQVHEKSGVPVKATPI